MGDMSGFGAIIGAGLNLFKSGIAWQASTSDATNNQLELERQARLEDALAVDAVVRGKLAAGRLRQRGQQLAGKQRLAYAASGIEMTSGTAVDVQAGTQAMVELDAMMLENNAAAEAWGHKRVSDKYLYEAYRAGREAS
jgi:hypothetical protein